MASIATSAGSYYIPNSKALGHVTPAARKSILHAQTTTAGASQDQTNTAFGISSGADFVIDFVSINVHKATTTARYTLLMAGETFCTFTREGPAAITKELDFGGIGIRCIPNTSTESLLQFVASCATATGTARCFYAKGHYA